MIDQKAFFKSVFHFLTSGRCYWGGNQRGLLKMMRVLPKTTCVKTVDLSLFPAVGYAKVPHPIIRD